jgi:hypothetical protein
MNNIRELQRLNSPFPKPQGLCADGATLWITSRATRRLYALDRPTWRVTWETAVPDGQIAWGLTVTDDGLRVVCGGEGGPEDVRTIRRCLPGHGFDTTFVIPCPDESGSHLGWDGRRLHLSQWYPKKLLMLGTEGQVERTIQVPHGICGQVIVDGVYYLATTDAEETTDYWLTRVDPRPATPQIDDLARIPFPARGLAFDGTNFWTNHREQNQIVCFARPA